MKITIETIAHDKQVYPTSGDWRFDTEGNLNIFVSDMRNWKYSALIAIHELCEAVICKSKNIKQTDVDKFDIEFEKIREQFPKIIGEHEPGDMTSAPYYKAHQLATSLERRMAVELGVNWEEYDKVVANL